MRHRFRERSDEPVSRWFIAASKNGLVMVNPNGNTQAIEWQDVREIVTFKRDLLTVDSVRVAFRSEPHPGWVEIGEDDSGFNDAIDSMMAFFVGIPRDWREQVTQPPFATNHRRLFITPSESSDVRLPGLSH